MQPTIIVFCAFTREWAVDRWLDNLSKVIIDPDKTSLAVIIDVDDPRILKKIKDFAVEHQYRKLVYRMNRDWSPNEVRIWVRRQRIADVKTQSKSLVAKCDGDYVLSLEDDTVFPNLDINRLIGPLRHDQIGFVEGVQVGRWGVKMIGAWSVDDFEYPQKAETLSLGEGYQEIDGGGWYGYATTKSLYLECDYKTEKEEPWGPDVNFGLWLRNRGFKCLIDWESVFGHNDHNRILMPDQDVTTITFTRNSNKTWERQDVEHTK
jgi:hypothetical protein